MSTADLRARRAKLVQAAREAARVYRAAPGNDELGAALDAALAALHEFDSRHPHLATSDPAPLILEE